MAHDVFISYSTPDKEKALAVLRALEYAGIACWMAPRDIPDGAVWAGAIIDAMSKSRVMVLVFSSHSNASENVLNEVDAAVRRGVYLIPLRVEAVMPEGALEYHLRTRHWLDATSPPLERHVGQLVTTVRARLGTPTSTPTVTPQELAAAMKGAAGQGAAGGAARGGGAGTRTPSVRIPAFRIPSLRLPGRRGAIALGIIAALGLIGWTVKTRHLFGGGGDFLMAGAADSASRDPKTALSPVRAHVAAVRFFEAPSSGVVPLNQRVYVSRFDAPSARFIFVELKVDHAAAGRVVSAPVSCIFYGPSGGAIGTAASYIQAQPTWPGVVWANSLARPAGGWAAGKYRVDCATNGRTIGVGRFEVAGNGTAPPPASTTDLRYDIPSIRGRVATVRFYEGPRDVTRDARVYGRRFDVTTTRNIFAELELTYASPAQAVGVPIQCSFVRVATNEVIGRVDYTHEVNPGTTRSTLFERWGQDAPGYWVAGTYRVDCSHLDRRIATATFDIAAPRSAPAPAAATSGAIGARATEMRFYATNGDNPPIEQRVYQTHFTGAALRFVFVQIRLAYPPPGRPVQLPITCAFKRPDGTVLSQFTEAAAIEPDWRGSYWTRGLGSQQGGAFARGTYRVECSAEGRRLATNAFVVE
jgi:TIR domain-containing protein